MLPRSCSHALPSLYSTKDMMSALMSPGTYAMDVASLHSCPLRMISYGEATSRSSTPNIGFSRQMTHVAAIMCLVTSGVARNRSRSTSPFADISAPRRDWGPLGHHRRAPEIVSAPTANNNTASRNSTRDC